MGFQTRSTAIIALVAGLALAQGVAVPGTSVALVPPDGFVPSERFPGFERADALASIMVTEMAAPFSELTRGMTKAGMASRGMTLIRADTQMVDGQEALVTYASQVAQGTEFLKWTIIAGDARRSVMIVGTFPKDAEAQLGEAIKASLLTARWQVSDPPGLFEGLPFRVTPTHTLKLAGRMINALALTESGEMGPQGPDRALFIVGRSIAELSVADLRSFAESRARMTAHITNVRLLNGRSATIDGLTGYELTAEGSDTKTGEPVTLYQLVLAEGDGYVLMQGLVGTTRAARLLPEFRRVAESFKRTNALRPPVHD